MHKRALGIIVFLAIGTGMFIGCADQVSGGSQVGNPAVVAGTVVDSTGRPVAGVRAVITPEEAFSSEPYSLGKRTNSAKLNAELEASRPTAPVITDMRGEYRFYDVPNEVYRLFLHNPTNGTMFQKAGIVPKDDSLYLGRDTLSTPGNVIIHLPDTVFQPEALLVVVGTPLSFRTDSVGAYSLLLPPGNLNVMYYSPTGDSVIQLPDNTENIRVRAHDTTYVGEHEITYPTLVGETPAGTFSKLYTFEILNARSSHGTPLEYRFHWGTGSSFSDWTNDSTALHQWLMSTSIVDTVDVIGQARSKTDTTAVSLWSEPYPIILSSQPFVLSPKRPTGDSTMTQLDSAEYTTGGAVFNLDDTPVEYKFSAGDYFVSHWSNDSTVTIQWTQPGVYRLVASARPTSSEHSTVISESDTLSVFVH